MPNDKSPVSLSELVFFDKKEKGVVVTTEDTCTLSLKQKEMELLL